MRFQLGLVLAAALAFGLSPASATDHIDGPVTQGHPVADLSDLYAFPTPGKPGHLTVVLNTHPFALGRNHFSSKVDYRLTLRRVSLDPARKTIAADAASERVFLLQFDDEAEPHRMKVSVGQVSHSVDFDVLDASWNQGLRLFAGRRADPFFLDAPWANAVISKGKLKDKEGSNTMSGLSVLSIVLELDAKQLFGADVSVLGVVAESLNAKTGARFDRLARPEATNISMRGGKEEEELRDRFNTELAPFDFTPATLAPFVARLEKNLRYYDPLDGKTDWTAAQAKAYAELVTRDVLLVDVSKPTGSGEAYFALENALLEGKTHTTAGGRLMTDDAMDYVFSRVITRGQRRIDDGVDAPADAVTSSFPYLAKARGGLWNWLKTKLSRAVSGIPGRAYRKGASQQLPGARRRTRRNGSDHGHSHDGNGHRH